jgi:hypothetical protein
MSDAPETPVFTADDDRFHFHLMSDRWWETETSWYSFHHPERRLGGWVYTMARPNIGTVAGGCWVWDDTAHLPWEVPYSANFSALRLPRDQDLDDIALPTGARLKVVEPTRCYDVGFSDGDRIQLDLRFEGIMPPRPLTAGGSTFGRAAHFDQIGRTTGELVLHGERIEIDCLAMRDRTWGPRPEDRPRQASYITGADDGVGFLAVTNRSAAEDRVAYGFLLRDDVSASLVDGSSEVERDPDHGWMTRLTLRATDALGRELVAVGEPVSRIVINRHTFIDVNSLVRWEVEGRVAWGEDQDMWPTHAWSAFRRAARGA